MRTYQLESSEFTGVFHNGESADIKIQGSPELLSCGRGDYGAVYGAMAKINGDLTEIALKMYGQGKNGGNMQEKKDAPIFSLTPKEELDDETAFKAVMEARDRAFTRYQGVQKIMPEHTFPWSIQTENTPFMVLPLERNMIAGNDLPRFTQERDLAHVEKGSYLPYFSQERLQWLFELDDRKIKTIENWQEVAETLKIIAETSAQVGIFLNDAYFFRLQRNKRSKSKIKMAPFLGDFDDSYGDQSQQKKELQHAVAGVDNAQDIVAFNRGEAVSSAISFLEYSMIQFEINRDILGKVFY